MSFTEVPMFHRLEAARKGQSGSWARLMALGLMVSLLLCAVAAGAEEGPWKDEFERLCGYTDIATTLDPPKLLELISECDRLLERLEKLTDPKKKTYIFRTKKCRDLFRFVLETKEG